MNYLFRVECTVLDGANRAAQVKVGVLAGTAEAAIQQAKDRLMGVEMAGISSGPPDCVRRIIVRSVNALGKITEKPLKIMAYRTLRNEAEES